MCLCPKMYCLSYFIIGSFSVSYQSQSEIGQFKCFNPKSLARFYGCGVWKQWCGASTYWGPKERERIQYVIICFHIKMMLLEISNAYWSGNLKVQLSIFFWEAVLLGINHAHHFLFYLCGWLLINKKKKCYVYNIFIINFK